MALEKGQFLVPTPVDADGCLPSDFRDQLFKEVADGWVKEQCNHDRSLWIYCYTHATQYAQRWNEVTRQARGLIMDSDARLVARGMQKFFNFAEHSASDVLFSAPEYLASEKVDGSLALSYVHNGEVRLATKASFDSTQAQRATQILHEKYPDFVRWLSRTEMPSHTWCFEVIYPENRIVSDYGGVEDLVLLAEVNIATGSEPWLDYLYGGDGPWTGPMIHRHQLRTDQHPLESISGFEIRPVFPGLLYPEGVVVEFKTIKGNRIYVHRVKVKQEEYMAIHAFVSNISNRVIWRHLFEGKIQAELYEHCPDEFYDFVKDQVEGFKAAHSNLLDEATTIFSDAVEAISGIKIKTDRDLKLATAATRNKRREFAELVTRNFDKDMYGLLFILLDEQYDRLDRAIWVQIEPTEVIWPTGIQGG